MKKAIIFILLLLSVRFGYTIYQKMMPPPKLRLTEIKAVDLNGAEISFTNRIVKRPTLLLFWSIEDERCMKTLQELAQASKKYGADVNFILFSDDAAEKLATFKNAHAYSFFFLRSTVDFDQYGIHSIPKAYFYDADQKLVSVKSGYLTQAALEQEINKLVGQKA